MKKNQWERFVSNNGVFKTTDIIFRKVNYINISWIVMITNSVCYAIVNYILFRTAVASYMNMAMIASYMNIAMIILTLCLMIYFHISSNYKVASMATVLLMASMVMFLCSIVGNLYYVLIWTCVVPPVAYSLLGRRRTRFVVGPFLIYVFLFIYLHYANWKIDGFSLQSFQNIFGVLICIILTLDFFEKSKEDTIKLLEEKNNQLESLSITDHLTSLYNRTKIDILIDKEIARVSRGGHPFSFAMIDIDHFKIINDNFGHLVGDQYLMIVAEIMKNTCRQIDFIGRWGGDEFLIICPETDENGVVILANKLLKAIQKYPFEPNKSITFSIGVSTYHPLETADSLVLRADTALYLAKHNGRNRCEAL